ALAQPCHYDQAVVRLTYLLRVVCDVRKHRRRTFDEVSDHSLYGSSQDTGRRAPQWLGKASSDWLAGQFNSATTCGVRALSIEASTACGLSSRWDAVRMTLARIC